MGPITKFLMEDHARLDALFDRAAKAPNGVDLAPGGFYDACDSLLASEGDALTQKMRTSPERPLRS